MKTIQVTIAFDIHVRYDDTLKVWRGHVLAFNLHVTGETSDEAALNATKALGDYLRRLDEDIPKVSLA